MKKVLLIQAPSPIDKEYKFIPFSIAYIAAVLERHNYHPEIYDMDALERKVDDFPKDYSSLNFDVIGISSHTVSYNNALRLAEIAKGLNDKSIIVLGGHHVTFMAEDVFNDSHHVDIVVIGEGETTFLEIVNNINNNCSPWDLYRIKGIAYQDGGKAVFTAPRKAENINNLPFPARHLLPMEKYSSNAVIASRGCPNRCAFCAGPAIHSYRTRTVSNIINELETMLKEDEHFFNDRGVVFLDNTFVNPKITYELCEKIKPLDLGWSAESRINVTSLELLKIMKEAGCVYIHFGIESGSEKVLSRMHKNISLEDTKIKVDYALSLGLMVACTFSIGHPDENENDIAKTIELIKELKDKGVIISTSIVTPFPGTLIWDHPYDYQVKIEHRDWEKYSFFNPVMSTKYLSQNQIRSLFLKVLAETDGYVGFAVTNEV